MFGKKEEKIISPGPDIKVVTIPRDFYAGANPTIKFKEVEHTVDLNKLSGIKEHERRALHVATAAGGAANLLSKRSVWIVGSIILFLLFAGGAGLYYWWQGREKAVVPAPPIITTPQTPEAPVVTPPPVVEPATTTPEPEIPVVTEPVLEFPSKILAESADLDADKISDMAEDLFNTDPANSDMDKDSYPDGHELYYLYNPNGEEPKKLIDSGFVRNYTNPYFGYQLYYPANWVIGAVDPGGKQVLFSTLTSENIEVRSFDLPAGQTFSEWFSINAPQENPGDYTDMLSRFDAAGKMRNDGLVYIFTDGKRVFVLLYHAADDSNIVNYKIVIQIMARSFKMGFPVPPGSVSTEEIPMTEEVINQPSVLMTSTESGQDAELMEETPVEEAVTTSSAGEDTGEVEADL